MSHQKCDDKVVILISAARNVVWVEFETCGHFMNQKCMVETSVDFDNVVENAACAVKAKRYLWGIQWLVCTPPFHWGGVLWTSIWPSFH